MYVWVLAIVGLGWVKLWDGTVEYDCLPTYTGSSFFECVDTPSPLSALTVRTYWPYAGKPGDPAVCWQGHQFLKRQGGRLTLTKSTRGMVRCD